MKVPLKHRSFSVEPVGDPDYTAHFDEIRVFDYAHDDYPDSWALAEYAKTESVKNEPGITVL